ncbi:MAG TPA: hypothetical protein VMD08_16925 [Candidatus Baltobacteraceae bacterium]|nr:hypothetical protein [Candidatus Baltobacteraceae bacterium]
MAHAARSPMSHKQVADMYFLEMRAKLLDIAAFMDRLDRAHDAETASPDFRVDALRRGCQELLAAGPGRTARIHLCLSDPTSDPIPDAAGLKGAAGAYSAASYQPVRG